MSFGREFLPAGYHAVDLHFDVGGIPVGLAHLEMMTLFVVPCDVGISY